MTVDSPGIDRRPIDQMIVDVGPEAFRRLAALFQEETRGAVVEMQRCLAAADWRELGRQAHSLKHSTASFGLADLAAVSLRLESAADGGDAEAAAGHLAALAARAEIVLTEFSKLIEDIAGGTV